MQQAERFFNTRCQIKLLLLKPSNDFSYNSGGKPSPHNGLQSPYPPPCVVPSLLHSSSSLSPQIWMACSLTSFRALLTYHLLSEDFQDHHHMLYLFALFIFLLLNSLLEKAMATHSSTLAWKIPWTEEPGGLQSMGSLRVGHDWATSLSLFLSCIEGNGTPVQYSCLENPRDGGAWWAAVYGVQGSDTTEAT